MSETKVSSQVGAPVQMPKPPTTVLPANRASRAGDTKGIAPGHKLPR